MVIGGNVYTGFKSMEDVEKAVPALAKMLADQKLVEKKAQTKITQ